MHFLFSLLMLALPQEKHPPDGRYTYDVMAVGWHTFLTGEQVNVFIRGDSIWVVNASCILSGKRGKLIDSGIIMKHKPTGLWIIGQRPGDAHAPKVGNCLGGPSVINFRKKIYLLC